MIVDEVLANLDRILRRTIGEDIELTLDLRATDGCILADPTQIEQIAMNLAVNARAAMPRGGQLTIETKCVRHVAGSAPHESLPTGDYVQICVEDSGVGMGPETLGRIFEPFFTRKKAGEGTGLGLATVHAIVMQTNGSVAVTSARGRGARFEILLPRAEPPAGVVAVQAPEPSTLPRATATVLLVEDELAVRNATRRMLERAGYRTLSAVCGEEALKVAHESKRPIDLVLTDVVMPGMGGAALAEAVRREWPNTPIVFVSGYTGGGGATDLPLDARTKFVAKPFDAAALCHAIEEAIAAQKAS